MLSLTQRLERLNQRLAAWQAWLERDTLPLDNWRCDGHPMHVGAPWGTPERPFVDEDSTVWHFQHPPVHIPKTWHTAETRLVLDMGGESLLFIDYLTEQNQPNEAEGSNEPIERTVTLGHDPNHQRFVLDGRHFALRTESVARLPFGEPARAPRLRAARLVRWEIELEQFLRLLTLVSESAQELLTHEVTPYLLDAAENALTQVPIPSHSPAYMQRYYDSDIMKRIWRRPARGPQEHHPQELDGDTRAAINRAYEWLNTRLQHLQQHYPPQGQLVLSGHAHIDVAWLWPLEETWRKAQHTFATAVNMLERYPEVTFNQSSAQLYTAIQDRDPALFARMMSYLQQPFARSSGKIPITQSINTQSINTQSMNPTHAPEVTNAQTEARANNRAAKQVSMTDTRTTEPSMTEPDRIETSSIGTSSIGTSTKADKDGTLPNASRWEAVGGMWVEPDTNMPTGESLVRQLLYGQRYFHAHSGRYQQVAWLPDCFGFAPALPQLLQLANIDSFFTMKVNWSETNRFPVDLFWWEGLDGSRVLTHTFDNPVGGYNGELGPRATLATWRNYRGKAHHPESLLTIGFGDGGGGLTDEMLERYRAMQALPVLPKITFSTVHDFFARAHDHLAEHHLAEHSHDATQTAQPQTPSAQDIRASHRPLPVWSGEMYLELHRGTTTSQGRIKRLHRQAEQALLAAETLSSMVTLATGKSVNTLVTPEVSSAVYRDTQQDDANVTREGDDANVTREGDDVSDVGKQATANEDASNTHSLENYWRVLLTQQFHDILPGSSIAEVYAQSERDLASVIAASNARINQQRALLADYLVKSGQRDGIFVVNSQACARPLRIHLDAPHGDAQETAEGFLLTRAKSILGFSGNVVLAGNIGTPLPVKVSERVLENAFVRVELAADGTIERIFDRHTRRDVLSGRGNRLRAYVDQPRQWDAWDIDEGYPYEGYDINEVSDWHISERGPHRVAIAITRTFQNSTIQQELRLWANSPRLDIHTRIDWHDRHWLLKAHFPVNVRTQHATFETAFGVVKRPTHRNTSWQQAQFEVTGHRFVDVSEPHYGVALLNNGRYGHHARNLRRGVDLGLSLLRSPTFPDPLADEGKHEFTYSLYPHSGPWLAGGVLREAEDLNLPLSAQRVRTNFETSLQLIELKGLPLALAALKPLEDEPGLLLRCFEPQGARGHVRLGLPGTWRAVQELDLLERPLSEPEMHFSPFQVRSWKLQES